MESDTQAKREKINSGTRTRKRSKRTRPKSIERCPEGNQLPYTYSARGPLAREGRAPRGWPLLVMESFCQPPRLFFPESGEALEPRRQSRPKYSPKQLQTTRNDRDIRFQFGSSAAYPCWRVCASALHLPKRSEIPDLDTLQVQSFPPNLEFFFCVLVAALHQSYRASLVPDIARDARWLVPVWDTPFMGRLILGYPRRDLRQICSSFCARILLSTHPADGRR